MYEAYVEIVAPEIRMRVFKSREEAESWLHCRDFNDQSQLHDEPKVSD
jgi:hypothetical protein